MNMKRTLISLTLVIAQITVGLAQQMTVTVDSVGQLSKQLPDSIRYTISELKICGPLNGSDLKIIQLMTSRLKAKKPTDAVLTSLDLSRSSWRTEPRIQNMTLQRLSNGRFHSN